MTNIKRTISKAYQQLSNFDRVRIETLLNQGFSQARIARELNRSRSTISREITRGSVPPAFVSNQYNPPSMIPLYYRSLGFPQKVLVYAR